MLLQPTHIPALHLHLAAAGSSVGCPSKTSTTTDKTRVAQEGHTAAGWLTRLLEQSNSSRRYPSSYLTGKLTALTSWNQNQTSCTTQAIHTDVSYRGHIHTKEESWGRCQSGGSCCLSHSCGRCRQSTLLPAAAIPAAVTPCFRGCCCWRRC